MTPPHQHADNPNAKKILIVCDEGLNRSATIRGQLQYWGHDCLTVGLNRNSRMTFHWLYEWCDLVILTAKDQEDKFWEHMGFKPTSSEKELIQIWDIGPDIYPRPYNKDLLHIVKRHIKQHEKELKPAKTT